MQSVARFSTLIIFGALSLLVVACSSQTTDEDAVSRPPSAADRPDRAGVSSSDLPVFAAGSQEELDGTAGSRIYFGYDRYDLSAKAQETLRAQASWLRQYPDRNIVIEGHCDERGTREYNLALGARRAAAAKRFLVSLGISPGRIDTISFGKERPEDGRSNETAWARNRRGVTVVQ